MYDVYIHVVVVVLALKVFDLLEEELRVKTPCLHGRHVHGALTLERRQLLPERQGRDVVLVVEEFQRLAVRVDANQLRALRFRLRHGDVKDVMRSLLKCELLDHD